MDTIISPIALYLICVLGAVGIAAALPRRNNAASIAGGLVLASAIGLAVLILGLGATKSGQPLPNYFFYPFAILALGASARMITHPRPVYSALYFILTIIASCGMYLLLSAEFMAFALVIIYAGAILITYLFVIMLATQAPSSAAEAFIDETDAVAREPVLASIIGFVLLAILTTAMFRGVSTLPAPTNQELAQDSVLLNLPTKVDRILDRAGILTESERVVRNADGTAALDIAARTITIENTDLNTIRVLGPDQWPDTLNAGNLDRLGYNLMHDHPMTIEIAGIILLMAMLGATVLARKHIELEDDLKAAQARKLGESMDQSMEAGNA
ncbi:MAG: NADH-quinone oxidoreductase subunit J [Phycisphaerales bacterium]|nr:NADH-quinone oxidoreductase subunit J [Phycisphaerales bacterium]